MCGAVQNSKYFWTASCNQFLQIEFFSSSENKSGLLPMLNLFIRRSARQTRSSCHRCIYSARKFYFFPGALFCFPNNLLIFGQNYEGKLKFLVNFGKFLEKLVKNWENLKDFKVKITIFRVFFLPFLPTNLIVSTPDPTLPP